MGRTGRPRAGSRQAANLAARPRHEIPKGTMRVQIFTTIFFFHSTKLGMKHSATYAQA